MEELNINIKTISMDFYTLINNIKHCSSFNNDSYIVKLKSLLNNPLLKDYYDVINYIIDNKVWLEQESFYNFYVTLMLYFLKYVILDMNIFIKNIAKYQCFGDNDSRTIRLLIK